MNEIPLNKEYLLITIELFNQNNGNHKQKTTMIEKPLTSFWFDLNTLINIRIF